ncbi:NfeD family protein [Microbacterium cremeum]|uniref:NfeD family protein n=1 Tax=Microbacterium cremeum TaxID=2782169 RepID=UPI00188969F2|nr:NfeD family protein [Microbacterium cremeum]
MLPDLTQYMWIAWLVLALVFIIIELLTLEFTFLMLAAGALIGGLGVNLLGGPWWLQIGVAAALSAVLLFTIRPLLLRLLHREEPDARTNVDALYGMGGRVVQTFVDGDGSVKLDNGETWTARLAASSPTAIDVGARVTVLAVHGATVEVTAAAAATPEERTSDNG